MNLSIATDGDMTHVYWHTDGDRDRDHYAHGIERMVYVLGFFRSFRDNTPYSVALQSRSEKNV